METLVLPIGLFLGGMAFWTLAEWFLHNFAGHKSGRKNIFAKEHLQHHAVKDYFGPWYLKALAAVAVLSIMTGILTPVFGLEIAFFFTSGFTFMYIMYEVIHRRAHTHGPTGPYSRWVRRNHFYHHFKSPKTNHGVSTPIWDMVFGTHVKVEGILRVPERHAMIWLFNADGTFNSDKYGQDYEVVFRKKKATEEEDQRAADAGEAPEL